MPMDRAGSGSGSGFARPDHLNKSPTIKKKKKPVKPNLKFFVLKLGQALSSPTIIFLKIFLYLNNLKFKK